MSAYQSFKKIVDEIDQTIAQKKSATWAYENLVTRVKHAQLYESYDSRLPPEVKQAFNDMRDRLATEVQIAQAEKLRAEIARLTARLTILRGALPSAAAAASVDLAGIIREMQESAP